MLNLQSLRNMGIASALCVSMFSPSYADDTEIFFGQSEDAFETNPNIIFVLDTSGSMTNTDGTNVSRMNRMQNAMRLLLDQATNFNVGLMAFNGRDGGSAVRYPVGDLDTDASELCPNGICPSVTVFSRPTDPNDDATQQANQQVSVNDDFLVLGRATTETLNNTIGGTTPTATFNDTDTANLITKSFTASSSGQENLDFDFTTDVFRWRTQQLQNTWFFESADLQESFLGYQFTNIDIPRNARIASASISFHLAGNQSGDVSAFITGEQTASPGPFPNETLGNSGENGATTLTLEERFDVNNRTNQVVQWDNIPGTPENPADAGNTIVTPDMSSLVNELINLPSWEIGSNMSFLVTPSDSYIISPDNVRTVFAGGAAENTRPVLTITFEELSADDLLVQSTLIRATGHVDEFQNQNSLAYWRNTNNRAVRLFNVGAGQNPRQVALRFGNTQIPKNAVIESAFLRFTVTDPRRTAPLNEPIEGWKLVGGPTDQVNQDIYNNNATYAVSDIPITLNFRTELSANPEADQDTPLDERVQSPDLVSFEVSEASASDRVIESPNLADIIQPAIDLDDWQSGNTLSVHLSASGDYQDTEDAVINLRSPSIGNATNRPRLEITYRLEEEAVDDGEINHIAGIRFRDVAVPPGATIESARLVMHAAAPTGEPGSLTIRGERTDNSRAFTANDNDIGGRTVTDASQTWALETWAAVGDQTSVNVDTIVQEITSQSAWCSGNSLTLLVDGIDGQPGFRLAQSIEFDPIFAPSLEITYAPDSVPTENFCANSSIAVSAAQGNDDGSQNLNTQSLRLNDPYLSTSRAEIGPGNSAIGLRFAGIQLPPGTIISSATLSLAAATDMPNGFNVSLSMEQTEHAEPYSTSDNQRSITGRGYSTAIPWTHPGGLVTGDNLFSTDISEFIQTAVDDPNWDTGNAIALKIEANSGLLDIVSNDGEESLVPQLIIQFQTTRDNPGSENRDQILQAVNELQAGGATPIVESLYEAALYMRGENVDYGTRRGNANNRARFFRVSHPGSYDGGEVSRQSTCTDGNLNSDNCRTERILPGSQPAVYDSPISSQCQSNHIVLLSDGGATSNTAINRVQNLIGQSCDSSQPFDDRCGVELAEWLFNTDQSSEFAESQPITTHTVGFNLNEPELLMAIADAGNGTFEPANSATELLAAFRRIINNVSNRNASFVAPGATVSQFNRLRNSNEVYYAMFEPSGSARWQGNLKRYRIGTTDEGEFAIFDDRGDIAVDADEGTFAANARSFWSSGTDGDNVDVGGAAERLGEIDYTQRNVYTFNKSEGSTDLTDAVNAFDPNNSTLNIDAFSFPPLVENDPTAVGDIIRWGKGADVADEDGDEIRDEVRPFMGDPLHSVPLVTHYADGESVIFMATNQGFLHALDTDTGDEHFAFIPEELYDNVYRYYVNATSQNRPYGLDGGKTLWHDDTDRDGLIDPNETAILYIGMRRGGNSYFALDVSDYRNPKYLWSIEGGQISGNDGDSTTAEGDYRELSSTWSLPVKTKIIDNLEVKDVIVFAGGYDQNQDATNDTVVNGNVVISEDVRSPDSIGRAIFIADAETGELIWQSSNGVGDFSAMNYSIPSQVRVIDINFDGIADQLYVGDMGGQLWRLDFDNNLVLSNGIGNRIEGNLIASIAGDTARENRKFYYPPDVAVVNLGGQQVLTISIGSGWRAHPLDNIVEDRFYSFRSPHVFGARVNSLGERDRSFITENSSGLIDVTDDVDMEVPTNALGWYIRFDQPGEKVLSPSLTFNNQVLFTSYEPSNAGFSCDAAIGSGSFYALNIFNGAPILNLDGIGDDNDLTESDRGRVLANPGLPPEVSVLFPEAGSGSGADGDPLFQVGKETITELESGDINQTTFWQEVTENHDQ